MKPASAAWLLLGALALGCLRPAPQPTPAALPLTEQNVSLVIARRVSKETGPTGISDRLAYDGKIFAFATFHWEDLTVPAGEQELEFRWYSGDKWVSSYRKTHRFTAAPYYAWASTYVTNIGPGKGRVELYCQGKRIAGRAFELTESRWNPSLPRT